MNKNILIIMSAIDWMVVAMLMQVSGIVMTLTLMSSGEITQQFIGSTNLFISIFSICFSILWKRFRLKIVDNYLLVVILGIIIDILVISSYFIIGIKFVLIYIYMNVLADMFMEVDSNVYWRIKVDILKTTDNIDDINNIGNVFRNIANITSGIIATVFIISFTEAFWMYIIARFIDHFSMSFLIIKYKMFKE